MTNIHQYYNQLTPQHKDVADDIFNTINSLRVSFGDPDLQFAYDDRAEHFVDSIAQYIIASNPQTYTL